MTASDAAHPDAAHPDAAHPDAAGLAELAATIAVDAGQRALAGWRADIAGGGRAALGATAKSSLTDIVTRHDAATEQVIVAAILAARPDDAIVGEEGTDHVGTSGVRWHIDPIDGTTNFLYGFPLWCTSIAAADDGGALGGAIYVPCLDELFVGTRGGGATLNGAPLTASVEHDLGLALVGTGFGYTAEQRRRQADLVATLAGRVRDLRRTGSAAIDLAYTAAGRLDAYFEEHLHWWDIAAGELIAREAGCTTGDYTGGPAGPRQLLVAAPALFSPLGALLAD